MKKISCDVCMDLIPLVKDNIASNDSKNLVLEHIEQCEQCKSIYHGEIPPDTTIINDKKILKKIKINFFSFILFFLVAGSLLGIGFSLTQNMFYNIVIMPILGGLSYILFKKRTFVFPLILFILSYVEMIILTMVQSEGSIDMQSIFSVIPICIIYFLLCYMGIFIANLLDYAFRKEGSPNEKN